jgi:BlaI family transcriptional regulator, penicillinase repressor
MPNSTKPFVDLTNAFVYSGSNMRKVVAMDGATHLDPTERELAILRVLWSRGPCTVRDVHKALSGTSTVARTTVLKLMQIMFAKGLVRRDETEFSHVYSAVPEEQAVERQLVRSFTDKVFGGSAMGLVSRALDARPLSAVELDDVRRLIDEAAAEREGS